MTEEQQQPVQPVVSPQIQESANTTVSSNNPPQKKKFNPVLGIALVIVLLVGLTAAYFLGQQDQDIRQQAATCKEECPGSDGVLRNCTPPESDGSSEDSICGWAGRIESCGGQQYCCPQAGGAWTTNMTACQPSPSPSPTPTPTPSPSPSPSPSCTEQCPGPDGILRNCTPPEADGTSEDSICNAIGRTESCGGTDYCCDGDEWTTDMAVCTASPSPSTSPSPSPSPTPAASPTPSPSPSPTPTTETTYSCNSSCTSNTQCQTYNSTYICYQSKCRLDSNPTSTSCTEPTSSSTQPELPAALPESGSEDVLNWIKAGLGAIGIGAALMLLL